MTRPTFAHLFVAALIAAPPLVAAGAVPAAAAHAPAGHHAVAGDFDGDGKRDLAVGAPGGDRVRVRYTRAHPHHSHVAFLHPNASSTIPMAFGHALAIGDFNGDGFSDLAVGAPDFLPPGQTGGFGNPETEGAVFVFEGSVTGLHAQPLELTGPYDGDEPYDLGAALAAADINGDGRSDLAANLLGADNGNIRVFYGSSTGLTLTGTQALDDFEAESLAFGDFNKDGRPDLIAGSTTDLSNTTDEFIGDVDVFPAHAAKLKTTPVHIRGDQVGAVGLGTSVATGDLNGDGYADAVVGAALDKQHGTKKVTGSIVVLLGGPHGLKAANSTRIPESRLTRTRNRDLFGTSVAVAKVTGDKYADIVVGAPGDRVGTHAHAGAVYFIRGAHSASGVTLSPHQRWTQNSPHVPGPASSNSGFGAALLLAQLAGDAHADLVIGAPNESHGALHSGFVVRLLGTGSGLTGTGASGFGDPAAHDKLGTAIR